MANEVIAVGMTCYDHVVVVPSLDAARDGCHVTDVKLQGGGVAATAAVAARALGARAQLWVRVGEDDHGEFIIADLRRRGIDTSELQVIKGARTAISTVLVEEGTGERRFLYFEGSGMDSSWESPDYSRIDRARAVIVDGRWPRVCLATCRRARAHAVPIIADLGHASDEEIEMLKLADYPIISEVSYPELAGEKSYDEFADPLLAEHAEAVLVTRGRTGTWMKARDGKARELGVFDVPVVDTTGAGDVFHGAFAFAITDDMALEDAVAFASAAASLSCTALGCRGEMPSKRKVEDMVARDDAPQWVDAGA